jgi:choline dehydrogenase-like flavoprotein
MNTMLYVRGHRYDYDTWARLGNKGWAYEDVLPFFKKSEDNQRGADAFHGVGGPLTVSDPVFVHPLLQGWVAAAQDAGHAPNADFNGADQEGVGSYQVTQRHGLRCSSAVAFLDPAADRPNLTVLHSTLALRLRFAGSLATGLEVDHLGEVRTIRATREIVLSSGAYNSPHLLLQSGVGPADELASAGVEPVHDLPDVGCNLQDHAGCFLSFFSDTPPVLGPDTSAAEERLRRDGVSPMAWTEVGGFLRSSEDVPAPDIQVHAALGIVRDQGLAAPLEPGMSFGPYVARPASRGSVRLRHGNPYAKPRITHNYLADADDQARLREGVRICMRIAREKGLGVDLRASVAAGLAPPSDLDHDIDDYIRTQSFSFYHPSSTCMMGAVVDHELRVHGLDNVRVADTSIMPTLVTGNTNAPAIMIGERAADFIRGGAHA